jgi:hypothetical protein
MAKNAEYNFKIRQLANGFIVTGSLHTQADEWGPLDNGERAEYLALTLEDAAALATKGIEQFKIRLAEAALNGEAPAQQGIARPMPDRAVVQQAVAILNN